MKNRLILWIQVFARDPPLCSEAISAITWRLLRERRSISLFSNIILHVRTRKKIVLQPLVHF